MTEKNVLLTITAYPPSVGGGQLYAHEIAKKHITSGSMQVVTHWNTTRMDWLFGITLCAPRPPLLEYEIDGIKVSRVNLPQSVTWRLLPWVLGYYVFQESAIGRLSDALVPLIADSIHQPALIHNIRIGREPLSFASYKLARHLNIPFVLTPLHHPRWSRWPYLNYVELYRKADAVIVLTPYEQDVIEKFGVPRERIFVTGTGPIVAPEADPDRFRSRHQIRGSFVLFIGQKYAYKHFQTILEAAPRLWRKHPDLCFVFIGARTSFSIQRFKEHSDPRIIELGIVDLSEKTDALAACTLLCVPSTQESFGTVYLEAWHFDKPVIGGSSPAIRDVITDGEDGFIVQPTVSEIADRIERLLANEELRQSMGQRGNHKLHSRFMWEQVSERTEAAYQYALTNHREKLLAKGPLLIR